MHVYSNFNTLRMLRYVTGWDFVVLALEIIFIVYLLYYSVEEIMEIAIIKLDYFKNGWNVFDILIIIMGYMTVAFYIYVHFETTSIIKTLVDQTEAHFPNFSTLGSHQKEANELMAVFILLAWIKVRKLKYVAYWFYAILWELYLFLRLIRFNSIYFFSKSFVHCVKRWVALGSETLVL